MKRERRIQKLVEKVFEKAKRESKKDTPYGLCKYLHEQEKLRSSERNLTRYYNYFVLGKLEEKIRPDEASLDEMARYSGFGDFRDYIEEEEEKELGKLYKNSIRRLRRRLALSMAVIGILSLALVFFISRYYRKNCMVWTGDHYEKIRCSGLENEKRLDEIVLQSMREIENPMQCKHDLWYDKSDNKVSFFTYFGEHPTNGKTLKRVTQHICEKYILERRDSVLAQNNTEVLDSLK